jgi:hypothetical protein
MLAFQEFISARECSHLYFPFDYLAPTTCFHMIIFLPFLLDPMVADGTALKKYELCL